MIIERYIASNLLRGWLTVLLVVGSVFGLIAFITELERTRFDYDALAVAQYTLMTLPQQMVGLAPVIALLGSILALAGLDRFNELTVVCCAGVSRRKLLGAIALPTLGLMLLLWAGLEFVTPALHQQAEQQRHSLRYRGDIRIPDGGVWSRSGRRYTHLGSMTPDGVPGAIDIFDFDEQGRLERALYANRARVLSGRRWLLINVREKQRDGDIFVTRKLKELEVERMWAADELPTLSLTPDSMTLSVLWSYSNFLRQNGQPWTYYLAAFWQKLMLPLTAGAMVLLATPISASLGSRRNRNFGVNMGIGALIGILFYLGAQIIYALGQLLDINVALVALIPTLLVASVAALLLQRMRW
ncbi:MAG: LPS export ABC transporter permease LptG [Halieaceae bacterium]|jgi:lipopolysaccharide export system permease protein|nr:LPS export ABC transporter permease LptG [Halieaceae bacterium]